MVRSSAVQPVRRSPVSWTSAAATVLAPYEQAAAPRWLPPSLDTETIERLPLIVNLILYGGDDFALILAVSTPLGEPADLAGAAARAQIRAEPSSGSPVLAEFTPELGEAMITLHLAAAASALLPEQSVYDCKLDHGITTTLIAGDIRMYPGVTR